MRLIMNLNLRRRGTSAQSGHHPKEERHLCAEWCIPGVCTGCYYLRVWYTQGWYRVYYSLYASQGVYRGIPPLYASQGMYRVCVSPYMPPMVGRVGYIHPGMPPWWVWWGIYTLVCLPTVLPWVHHHTTVRTYPVTCTSVQRRVSREEALGSNLGIVREERPLRVLNLSSCGRRA